MDVMQATSRDFWWSKRDSMRTAAPPCALLCALLASCTASGDDVRPPDDQLFFPSGMAIGRASAGPVLFVANSNSELRYDSGAIAVIDLNVVEQAIASWNAGNGQLFRGEPVCGRDREHRETQVCEEREFMIPSAGVRIGNFATDIAVQSFGTQLRVIVPTRGDPSITWADFDGTRLTCAGGTTAFPLCDAEHRLSSVRDQGDGFPILDEPFGVFADTAADASGFAVVTHLIAGALTLVDSPSGGSARITDTVTNVFLAPPNIEPAASAVVGRRQGTSHLLYVGSSTENRIQTFTVGRPVNESAPYLVPGSYFLVDGVGSNSGGSSETRGMQFSKDGNRLYVVNRRPPSLSIFDTSVGPTGAPRNVPTGSTDICRQASTVAVLQLGDDVVDGDGERAYVTCFQGGQVYVVDPRGQSQVEDVLTVGRGPYTAVVLEEPKRLFISNFLEDTIAVVDVNPRSAGYNRVVLRIGLPKEQP